MDVKKMNLIVSVAVLVLALFLIAGCEVPTTPGPGTGGTGTLEPGTYQEAQVFEPDEELKANNFKSVAEFNDFVQRNAGAQDSGYMFGTGVARMAVEMDMAMEEGTVAMPAVAGEAQKVAEPSDYSETNIQVEGVDEADIIKTDGNYIYTVSGKTLFIIKAYPGEDAEIVSTIKFDNQPSSLFVNDDYMAVFGNYRDIDFFKKIDFTPRQGMTFFNIYDISDRDDPELEKEYKFEGNYFQARMISDYVYFITTSRPEYRKIYPTPVIIEDTAARAIPVRDIYFYPIPYQSAQFANIHAIDITRPGADINSVSIAVEGSQNMYMSKNNIFITYTERINEWDLQREITIDLMMDELTQADKELIEKIKNTDNEVLSQREKENKIFQIIQTYVSYLDEDEQEELTDRIEEELEKKLEEYKYMEFTLIHKISVDDEEITIDANGKVPGHVINQFSMDEYDDVFRIATTISQRWSRFDKSRTESTNNIYTLDKDLDLMDELEGLAEGERIYSTRFIGDRLYMVTFRQVDPFFVIDLSNPNKIKELGELKIPGFSRYLHPYDKDTIIGIGRDASTTGRTQGLKISLFDVRDVENPEEIAKFVTKERYAQSTAEYEHKAFLFSKEKELLVIPVYSHDYRWDRTGGESYNGAMVFKITRDEIDLRGIVDHSMAKAGPRYGQLVERSLYIEELLYTKSPTLLRINEIDDLSSVKNIDLEGAESPYPIY
ncbi:beta-propeller domain-containing protein [Candidatus Woesearchaeota archaeon]|nr:beta-propeller domain-containing protein [Candidatus Woesearchaeota archaeon]